MGTHDDTGTRVGLLPRLRSRRLRTAAALGALALMLSTVSATALVLATPTTAQAAPGTAGTPQAASVAFQEDFENGVANAPVSLTAYTGASGQKYTADPAWLANCNGQVRNFNTPSTTLGNCQIENDSANLNQLAYALGVHGGAATPAANHAVTAYTENNPGANATEFQTASNIPLASSSGRFLTFSVDTAASNCPPAASAPLYQFAFLNQAGAATNVGGQMDACSSAQTVNAPASGSVGARTVKVGTYTSNGSLLFSGSTLGIRMQNANGSGAGNDAAFDNIKILDVTPQLDKAFTPTAVQTGGTSTLTFTVTNTSELASKAGWGFTDNLPAGLTLANSTVGGTCNATTAATAGGTSVAVTNGTLAAGQASCTITVQVTSPVAGSFTNGPTNIVPVGLNPPGSSTVVFSNLAIPNVTCTTDPVIFNTGYNSTTGGQAANGAADERWTVAGGFDGLNHVTTTTAPTGPSAAALPPAGTTYAPAYAGKVNTLWANSQSGKSQWVSADYVPPANGNNQSIGYGDWYYRYQFNLDPVVDPASFQLDMSWLADNSVNGVWVNNVAQTGANLPQSPNTPYIGGGFLTGSAATTSLKGNWQTGLNTILVQVKSYYVAEGFNAEVRSTALCPAPAYTVTKAASATTVQPGGNLTYTVKVKNTGNVPYTAANPAKISDNLGDVLDDAAYNGDAAVSFSAGSTSAAPTVTGTTLSWSGPLAVGETATITYSVTVDRPDTGNHSLGNTVTPGTGGSCDPAGSCSTVTPVQSFSVTKKADASTVVPGDTITYTVTVKNTGKVDYTAAAPASFTDNLTAVLDDATYNNDATSGATYATPTLSWSGALAAGDTVTITYSVTVNTADTGDTHLDNSVVTPPGDGGNCEVGSADPECTVLIPEGSYTVSKTASTTTTRAGDTVIYQVTVHNTGSRDYTAQIPASFSDSLSGVLDDAKITTGPDNGATVTGTTLNWSGPLAIDASVTITYTATVNNPDTGDKLLKNTVRPTGPGGGCDTAADCTTTTDVRAFTTTKTSSPADAVKPGDTVTYTVTVKSTGTADFTAANPASFTDDLSAVLDDATVTGAPDNGATITGSTLSWSGALAAGATKTITYTVTVKDPDTGNHVLTNAVVPGGGGSCVPDECGTTNPVQSYSLSKTSSAAGPVHPGDTVTYTVVVTNTGKAAYTAAAPAAVTDDLSKVLDDATYVAGSATNGATVNGLTLNWSGPLAVGGTQTITYKVLVGPAGTGDGTLTNSVTGGDCVTPADCTTTNQVQAFTVTKTADATDVVPGATVTYTITVKNTGVVDYTAAAPASFTDDLTNVLDDATYNNDATGGASYAAPTLSWSGALAAGATTAVTYSVTVKDPDTGDKHLNNTVVTPPEGGCPAGTDNAQCTSIVPSGSYTVAKTASSQTVNPGGTITYTVTVTNTGQVAYTATAPASFRDDLTNVLDDATYNGDASNGATVSGKTLTWSGPLAIGKTVKVTYSVKVNKPDTGNHALVNAVVPTEPGGACDTAGSCLTNTPVASYTVHKTVSTTSTVKPGAKVRYTVTVTNTGAFAYTAAKPASFTDEMKDVLDDATYNGDATNGAKLNGNILSWSGPLGLGGTVKVTYSVTVNNPDNGNHRLINTVDPAVDGGSCDPAGSCDTRTPIDPGPGLATTGSDAVAPGLLAILLLGAGTAFLVIRRRRATE